MRWCERQTRYCVSEVTKVSSLLGATIASILLLLALCIPLAIPKGVKPYADLQGLCQQLSSYQRPDIVIVWNKEIC